MIDGQLSIFDLFPEYPDFNTVSEEKCVSIIGDVLGLKFSYSVRFGVWKARIGCIDLSVNYSTYMGSETRFISVGYDNRRDHSGGGAPCDSIDEAIRYFRKCIEKGNRNGKAD